MPEELLGRPAYTGAILHNDKQGGYSAWLPSDWFQIPLNKTHKGMFFSPYQDDINTSILFEKRKLKIHVKADDHEILSEGFRQDILSLPGAEIESQSQSLSDTLNVFDARFTFFEGEIRRKRWVRNIYWGEAQLVIIAQGRTIEDFNYWLPMFYNTITTLQII